MTTGASGSYAVNGTNFTLQPTSGRWMPREEYGIDGGGHSIYPRDRDFELQWDLISPASLNQLINFYNAVSNTGTVTADLPQFNAGSYVYYRYSGVVLTEPEVENYFQGYTQTVRLIVRHVITS